MSEETCKPKRNWDVALIIAAAVCFFIAHLFQNIRASKLEKRIEAVEGMFAK